MKLLLFWGMLSLFGISNHLSNETTTVTPQKVDGGGGLCTIEQMLMIVELDDPLDSIVKVQFYDDNGLQRQDNGCNAASCSYDIGNLASGTYEVVVYTALGETFSDDVVL